MRCWPPYQLENCKRDRGRNYAIRDTCEEEPTNSVAMTAFHSNHNEYRERYKWM